MKMEICGILKLKDLKKLIRELVAILNHISHVSFLSPKAI